MQMSLLLLLKCYIWLAADDRCVSFVRFSLLLYSIYEGSKPWQAYRVEECLLFRDFRVHTLVLIEWFWKLVNSRYKEVVCYSEVSLKGGFTVMTQYNMQKFAKFYCLLVLFIFHAPHIQYIQLEN